VYEGPPYEAYAKTTEAKAITRFAGNFLYRYPVMECFKCGRKPRDGEQAADTWKLYRDDDGIPHVVCRECAREIAAAEDDVT
jgi:hypothetical protein